VTTDNWTAVDDVLGTGSAVSVTNRGTGVGLGGVTDGPSTIPVAYTAFRFIIKT
jgi:hypothetical protein